MLVIKKILKIIVIIVAILISLFIILTISVNYYGQKSINQPQPAMTSSTFELMLSDPHLFYGASFSYGLCHSEIANEDGGCHSEIYLYDSGQYISTGYWEGIGNKRIDAPSVEKKFGKIVMDKIIKLIRDSEIMNKECPDGMTVDASWDYQLQLGDQKKRFINRPVECQPTLDEVDKIIAEATKAE